MKTIWKYPLALVDRQRISLPIGAMVLSIINQNDELVLYAYVDTETKEQKLLNVAIVGIGNPVELAYDATYWSTVSTYNGKLVWHIFVWE